MIFQNNTTTKPLTKIQPQNKFAQFKIITLPLIYGFGTHH